MRSTFLVKYTINKLLFLTVLTLKALHAAVATATKEASLIAVHLIYYLVRERFLSRLICSTEILSTIFSIVTYFVILQKKTQ